MSVHEYYYKSAQSKQFYKKVNKKHRTLLQNQLINLKRKLYYNLNEYIKFGFMTKSVVQIKTIICLNKKEIKLN